MNEHDARVSQSHGGGRCRAARRQAGRYEVRLVVSDPRPTTASYNVIANPMLWFIQHYLGPSNAPDIRREEIEAFEFGYNVVNEDPRAGGRGEDRGREANQS